MNMHENNMTSKKNMNLTDDHRISDPVTEEHIARSISELLHDRAQHLEAAHVQRLSAARNAAVNYLAEQQAQCGAVNQVSGGGHVLHWFSRHVGQNFEQHRVASAALLVGVMLLTFFAIQQFGFNHNLENSDAFLLASDLPPEAYADKGFDAWIQSN